MNYKLDTSNKSQHYLNIEFSATVTDKETILQLPSWRPGRYELGNFAKNIQKFEVTDENGKALRFEKKIKDSWIVATPKAKKIIVNYNYYSVDFNAGSTFLDNEVLYVNPVNCFIYVPQLINTPCVVEIPKGKDEKIACGIPYKLGKIKANNYHEMVDTPFLVSTQLQFQSFESDEVDFTVWFYGECRPNWETVITDFKKFTDYQIKQFGSFPVKEYHFINIVLPFKAYHGVEHTTSTMILLGPGYDLMKSRYIDLLGVSSHELYHAWNIKTIRPEEMNPYDYTKENYSKLGYVAEGVTTYMGDLVLYESGVFDRKQYCVELNQYLKRHYTNGGRLNKSVAESSFDTWLDGYEIGTPDRKSSIYVEGALISFMIDTKIRESSKGKYSLHTVMKKLYTDYGKKEKGYSEGIYKELIEEFSGISFTSFFKSYINGCKDFTKELERCLFLRGFKLEKTKSLLSSERYGIIFQADSEKGRIVQHVQINSSAYIAGLRRGDEISLINTFPVENNINNWLEYFENKTVQLTVLNKGMYRVIRLEPPNSFQFFDYKVS